MIRPLPHIGQMAPYALAQMEVPPDTPLISLAQNESLRPPSPLALEAAARSLTDGALYPDPDWTALRQGLAALHEIPATNILCGNGSLDLIGAIARCYAGPGRAVLAPTHAYPFFRTCAAGVQADFDTAEEDALTACVDHLLTAVRPDTAVVFVANPGNPTGTRISKAELFRLRAELPREVLLVIDEAYGEFADHLGESCFGMVGGENTIVLRTFSKAYGMAGFRVGWGLFPAMIAAEVRKVLNPNNVSAASQAAALAALQDQGYMRETCKLTAEIREAVADDLCQMGFEVYLSFTNFLLINLGNAGRVQSVENALRAQGIFCRQQAGAGLPGMLRMTIGPRKAMDFALTCLEDWKKEETR